MRHVLVTGGNGFIGRAVCEELLNHGYRPVVLDRNRPASNLPYESIFGDVRDPVHVTEAMSHVDGWMHLAGVLGTQETITNPLPAAETNILGGLNVLEAASQYNLPGVNIAVGNYWMNNTYSITKSTMERFCAMYRDERGLRVNVVRALNAYGPGQSVAYPYGPSKVRKIMPSFIMRALHGDPIEVYGDGGQVMDMIHVSDVADVLVTAFEAAADGHVSQTVFSAGTGRETSVLDIANEVAQQVASQVTGQSVSINHLPMRPGEPEQSIVLGEPDTLKELGISSDRFIPLEIGVAETVDFYRRTL
jgi:UDP-glucose 4-epimerase